MKPVIVTRHARQKLEERGATETVVIQTIQDAPWQPAEHGRLRSRRWYPGREMRGGRQYSGEHVEPIFIEEDESIVVVTVYVYWARSGESA